MITSILLEAASLGPTNGLEIFTRNLAKGPVYAGLTAFVGGLLASLTPCVYPMIAVTVSVFGARQAQSRAHAIGLSSAFVFGICAMFTPLGVGAALTGSLFGSLLADPRVLVFLAVVFAALSLSMFGAFEFAVPAWLNNRLASVGGAGYGGAFLVGLTAGIFAAPCTGPVLTGILLWIGKTRNVGLGAAATFAFSLGLGLPFWLVGALAISLPKGGRWTASVKSGFGIVLAVSALYVLKGGLPAVSRFADSAPIVPVLAAGLVIGGLALGAVHVSAAGGVMPKLRKGAALVAVVIGAFIGILRVEAPRAALVWESSETAARARATSERRPMIVDFTAEWCGACQELARTTLADQKVEAEAARFVAARVDLTNSDEPSLDALKDRYGVVGLPTIVLVGSDGAERARLTEFVPPDRFLELIRGVD